MAGDRHVMETGSAMTYEDIGTAAGVTRVYLSNKAPYREAAGNVIGMVGISRDITERKRAEEQARSLSLTDQLTGLYNRRGFLALATPLLERESRTQRDLYLFFADMDGLKYINDTFGHVEGDQAITDATRLLRSAFRESDILHAWAATSSRCSPPTPIRMTPTRSSAACRNRWLHTISRAVGLTACL